MSEHAPLEAILRRCAAAAPVPWYPKVEAAALGLRDADLAAFVEQLRRGGLIAATDPAPGYGRGFVLTPAGADALQDAGALDWLRRGEIPPRRSPPAEGAAADAAPAGSERERAVRMSLLAPFSAYVTYGLIAANVAVFLWGVYLGWRQGIKPQAFLSIPPPDLLHTTGSVRATDLMPPGRGLARLLTCCFVHFGLVHLVVNMISLHLVGPLLERMWGHARFLVLYLIAGLGGSCAAMVLRPLGPGGVVVSLAGASGALWGILASMAVWVVLNHRYLPRRLFSTWGMQIGIAFAINIAITYLVPGISAEAHYGGGAFGAVCALLLHFTRFGPRALRAAATAAVAALPALGIFAVTHPDLFNARWQADEQTLRKAAEKEAKDRDNLDMQERVMPRVREMEKEALKHAPDALADPLINRHPDRRDEERVKKAVAAYGEAEGGLRPAADLLRQAGPYGDPEVEKARQVRLELIEARLDLFALNKRCLEAGKNWSGQDEKKREEAILRVHELTTEWRKLLQ